MHSERHHHDLKKIIRIKSFNTIQSNVQRDQKSLVMFVLSLHYRVVISVPYLPKIMPHCPL